MGKPLPVEEPTVGQDRIPERLMRCYVEDWADPGREPVESWRGPIQPGTPGWSWHWQLVARRRQRAARATYRAENGITDPWPVQGRPMWRRAP